jgi:DNA replication protein DnaC
MSNLEEIKRKMEYLKMQYAPSLLSEILEEATKNKTKQIDFFETILRLEIEHREQSRIATSLRVSGLPKGMHLDNFDYMFQPSVEKERIEYLATSDYIRRKENVLFFGPPGVGNYRKFLFMERFSEKRPRFHYPLIKIFP